MYFPLNVIKLHYFDEIRMNISKFFIDALLLMIKKTHKMGQMQKITASIKDRIKPCLSKALNGTDT
jgi:hypothetical protein